MVSRGYANQQMKITGLTRGKDRAKSKSWWATRRSCAKCRGFDAHGFSDLGASVSLRCPLASFHPAGNPLREKWPTGNVRTLLAALDVTGKWPGSTSRRRAPGCWRAPLKSRKC